MQRNLMGQQYGALSQGYGNALKAAMDELNLQNQAAQVQGKLAEMEQSLGLTGAGALSKAGAEKQAYEQAKLDFPMKTATDAAALMRGFQVPTTQTEKFVGPKAGMYQTSPLSNILGVLSTIGGIKGGSAGDKLIGSVLSGFKDLFSGGEGGGFNWEEWAKTASGTPGEGYNFEEEDYGGLARGGLAHIRRR